ncbi:HET-domain-containing protein, partial [Coniochaeta sp. PMI_546]
MWLLNTANLELEEFNGNIPPYAILSHVWSRSDEISFIDMTKHRDTVMHKLGFSKIYGCCDQALRDGYKWAWIDSCCIDRRNSAELSEAINSMFQWYGKAKRCYVYLADVNSGAHALQELKKSRWFTRGWTLQELIAPANIVFFARDWTAICQTQRYQELRSVHDNLTVRISRITGIPREILTGKKSISQTCVAQRMYWASRRLTTRPEDRAYSLMGLFNISMPILYGEGLEKAFDRLQRVIMSKTPDQSIFAW